MPKDILILMPDQLRADWLGCYGADYMDTPNIDRLASQGAVFSRCLTSCPICMPARSSFLTGMYPHNHGQWKNVGRVHDVQETYLHALRSQGYRTCHVGKSHLHPHGGQKDLRTEEPYMNALGWDDVLECTGPWSTLTTTSILTDWLKENNLLETFVEDYKERRKAGARNLWPSPLPDGMHPDDFIAQTAVDYIHDSNQEQPLCLFVGLGGPHSPWDSPKRFDHYDPNDMPAPLPADPPPDWLKGSARTHHEAMMNHNADVTPEEWARIRSLYSGRVEHVDSCFGKVLAAWENTRGEDTWVLFWSDHGEMLGDKQRTSKGVFYESSSRVPAILRPPGGNPERVVCDALIGLTDLTATVLEAAECKPPSRNVFGKSVLEVFTEANSVGSSTVFSEISNRTLIHDDHWKMVLNSANEVLTLFDIEMDPTESMNLAGRSDTGETVARLRETVLSFHLRTACHQFRENNG